MLKLSLYSQNISQKEWKSNDFNLVFLKLDYTSNVTVIESTSDNIYVKYEQEGEFKENTILKTSIKNRELNIQEIISPTLKTFNDKLSVHKRIANTIKVEVPINFRTIIETKSCNMKIMSSFSDIHIKINEGKINLNQNKIRGEIKSISADIFCVNTLSKLLLSSKSGIISGLYNSSFMPNLIIKTIRGDIRKECL